MSSSSLKPATSTEADVYYRPGTAAIRQGWSNLFSDPLLSTSSLRAKALEGLPAVHDSTSVEDWVPMRSVYWKIYHSILPSPNPSAFPTPLSTSRATYDTLRAQFLRAPDGRWASDVSVPAGSVLVEGGKGGGVKTDLGSNNPLSLEETNPWNAWFADVDLRKVIRQDVERTFPDIPYFTIPRVRTVLTTILFIYSVLNPDVGYRQGMHELAAAILLAVDLDSLPESSSEGANDIAALTLSREHVEHDTWTLYESVMRNAKDWYQWRDEGASKVIAGGNKFRPTKHEQPIVTLCNHMHSTLLRSLDPQMWAKLEELEIEPQLYGIRWIRLLFTREFSLPDAMRLWDGVFASDPTLRIVEFLCIVMLLRIRNSIIHADYSEALTTLLRYPVKDPPLSISLLLSQALALRDTSISPAAGVGIVMENQELLGISAHPPSPDIEEDLRRQQRRPRPLAGGTTGVAPSLASSSQFGVNAAGRMAQLQMGIAGLGLGDVAKGLLEKGQSLGIDQAILSRVEGIRKNLPDFPNTPSYIRQGAGGPFAGSGVPLPSSWHSADVEAELVAIKQTMLDMSIVMARCLEGVERELQARASQKTEESHQPSTSPLPISGGLSIEVAFHGLKIIRDTLRDPTLPFDPTVILTEEERATYERTNLHSSPVPPHTAQTAGPLTTEAPTASSFSSASDPSVSSSTPSLPPQAHPAPPPPITSRRSFSISKQQQPPRHQSRLSTPTTHDTQSKHQPSTVQQPPETPLLSAFGFSQGMPADSSSLSHLLSTSSSASSGGGAVPPPPWLRSPSSFSSPTSTSGPAPVLPQFPAPTSSFANSSPNTPQQPLASQARSGSNTQGSGCYPPLPSHQAREASLDPLAGGRPVKVASRSNVSVLPRVGAGGSGGGGGDPLGAL